VAAEAAAALSRAPVVAAFHVVIIGVIAIGVAAVCVATAAAAATAMTAAPTATAVALRQGDAGVVQGIAGKGGQGGECE
jgi:hypothetical protein